MVDCSIGGVCTHSLGCGGGVCAHWWCVYAHGGELQCGCGCGCVYAPQLDPCLLSVVVVVVVVLVVAVVVAPSIRHLVSATG